MKIIPRTLLVLAATAGLALPLDVAAQARSGPSVEASLGLSARGGGEYLERSGPALDAIVTVPVRAGMARGLVAGISGGITGLADSEVGCTGGAIMGWECLDDYPQLFSVGLLGGVQRGIGGGASARVLAGPAYYQSPGRGDAFGLQGRADVAAPLVSRVAVVFSLRGSLLPDFHGEMLHTGVAGLGLRIQ